MTATYDLLPAHEYQAMREAAHLRPEGRYVPGYLLRLATVLRPLMSARGIRVGQPGATAFAADIDAGLGGQDHPMEQDFAAQMWQEADYRDQELTGWMEREVLALHRAGRALADKPLLIWHKPDVLGVVKVRTTLHSRPL